MIARLLILPPLAVAAVWYLLDRIGYPLPVSTLYAACGATLALSILFSLLTHPRPAAIFGTILGVTILPVGRWVAMPVSEKLGYGASMAPWLALAISGFVALMSVQPWVRYRRGATRARDRERPFEEVDRP